MNSTVIPPITCPEPTALAIDSFSANDVTVSWTAGDMEMDWEIAVQLDGTGTPGSGTMTTNNPHTQSGLTAQTAYEVYVRADCTGASNGYSNWVGPVDFTTACAIVIPEYNADMSAHVPDSCWEEAGSGEIADGPGSIGFSDWRGGTSYAIGSSNAINIFGTTKREWLISPLFDMSADDYQLEINVAVTDWQSSTADDTMGADDEVQLLITTDNGVTWSSLNTWNAANEPLPAGTEYVEDLTAYTGTVQFAIWASSGTTTGQDYDFHVGKFRVAPIPSSSTVDYCNLQFPSNGNITQGDAYQVFAQIFQTGVTEAPGQGADIEAWIGYNTIDAATVADFDSGWTWIPATYNSDVGNNDEYQADLGPEVDLGTTYYVSRFRYDGGVFAYGGINPGSSGGDFWGTNGTVSGEVFTTPTPIASLLINGCNDQDSHNEAYDAGSVPVVWAELAYDGNCQEIIIDTENSDFDTEIGVYDSDGNRVANNDDDAGGITPQSRVVLQGLPAGTYYIVAGAYNMTFNDTNFEISSSNSSTTGTIHINATTPNIPDFVNLQFPGSATITAGNTANIFAQIFESGVTPGAGAGANITAEIGVSAVDAAATADFETVDWTWTTAPYFGEVGNNDEYELAIGASLAPGTYYYVSRFSVDGGPFKYGGNTAGPGENGNEWDGVNFVSGVLTVNPKPEPTNHVTAFTAVADSDTEITLTWNDNDGTQPADGFLIVAKTGAANFYIPVDGTDDADDTDWSDDEAEVKVASGVQTYTFTGLNASTLYEFEIYPYTNSGANIDYKTDATVPAATATTDGDPCSIAITTYPFTDDFSSDNPCYGFDLISGTTNWVRDPDGGSGDILAPNSAPGFMEKSFSSSDALLISPVFDFTAIGTDGRIRVFLHRDPDADVNDRYRIFANTTNSLSGATQIFELFSLTTIAPTVPSQGWYEYTINVPSSFNTSNSVYIIFQGTTSAGFSSYDLGVDDFVVEAVPACTQAVVDSGTIVDDCINSEFSVDVVVSSVGDGTVITDGIGGSFPVVAGTVTVGPYPTGSTVTLTVEHSDSACNISLGNFEFDDCPTLVDCSGSGLDDGFCYDNSEFSTFAYASSDGTSELSILFNAGTVEDCCDFLIIYDGTDDNGPILFDSSASGDGDLTGLVFTALSGNIYMTMDSDFSVSCASGDEASIDYTLFCGFPPVTYTYNGSWSPSDPNGASTTIDDIVVTSGNAVINTNIGANNVTINPDAALTVNTGSTLTVIGEVTLESTSDMYSSLMYDGTVVGTVKYERFVNANTGGNDLIAPPLDGQTWSDFRMSGSNATDILNDADPINPIYLFGPFDKTSDDWLNYDSNTSTTLDSGTGYRAGTVVTVPETGRTLTFTGSVVTGQVAIDILDTGANHPDWNLIGNPYPTYLDMSLFLNFDIDGAGPNTETNMDILEDASGIYGYDGSASNGWDVITLANASSKDMAPGQGFFVAANDAFVAGHDITFHPSMRKVGTGDDFIAGRGSSALTFFKLNANTATTDYTTQFYFNDNATLGLDHGYDAKLWGGVIPNFALYSNLVENNTGLALALQALNPVDLVDVVIPLGVNANQGEQLTFTISETTLPDTIDVYLDDTLNNTSTLLNNSDYVITPISDITGTGRFYLRVAEQALSIDDIDFDNIKIYTETTPRSVLIHGALEGETTAKVFDLQGRLVHSSILNSNNLVNKIDAKDFSDGVYIVTLNNGVQEKSQKVIIR